MDKNLKKGIIVLSVIVIAAVAVTIVKKQFSGMHSITQGSEEGVSVARGKFDFSNANKPFIATIYIRGVIEEKNQTYNQTWLLNTIHTLKNDKKNKGILLFIDSPGGTVYHADEAYLALMDYKATGKSVTAYFGPMAASGGYYIGCAADKIYANRNCLTGSIGVISANFVDGTELLKKIGIKSTTIHTGKNKNMLNFNQSATEEQLQIMQSLADECYDQFTGIVSSSRKMDLEQVKKLADGRIYSALQAQKNGLVDDVMTVEQAMATIRNSMPADNLIFKDYVYDRPDGLRDLLMQGLSIIKNPQAVFAEGNVMNYLYTGGLN
ncbi:MAG: signal peptide peptidase SppA [Treponema sp.]|nr:signal peptide peptidase SppA [Treponema sp.]